MERNFKELISQMTLEEKAGMCSGLDFWHLKGVERLGIPSVMVCDGPHGLRKQDDQADHLGINDSIKAVCFPPACLSACSFDSELMYALGERIGKEAQANDVSVVLGPAVNIKRSPLCGRNFEYYSEDPYLTGETAAAFISGVQSQHTGTSIKHFAANNQEYNRMSNSSEVDERTLREIYLAGFETAVKKSQPSTVMCSYNRINGTYASENPWLLTTVLRDEWGFKGYVMSDWGAVNDRVAAIKAGMELEMPSSNGYGDGEIVRAVKNGTLDEAIVDRSVERILNVIFDWTDHRQNVPFTMEEDHDFARKVAEESMVLLKNEPAFCSSSDGRTACGTNVLPLSASEKTAFIGGFARTPRYQGGGSSHVNSFKTVSALDAIKAFPEFESHMTYAEGFPADSDTYDEALASEAVLAAKNADKAVIFAGLPESFESEGYDRKHMHLPDCQNRLIREILKVQPNVIVVLHNGAPVEMPWLSEVRGVLEAYLGGQAGGEAVIHILYGKISPSGKLAETIPYRLSDNPSYLNFAEPEKTVYAEGIYTGYRYYDKKEMPVAFPFGHGLSYTNFTYSNLKLDKTEITDKETLTVHVDVTNTGSTCGKEVVQLYVRDLTGAVSRPDRELKGYKKVSLNPGETKTVAMTLDKRSFAWYSTDLHDWYAASGAYEILIGASSRDIRLTAAVQMTATVKLPLKLHMNTTFGELLADERTQAMARTFMHKVDAFYGNAGSDDGSGNEAVSDDMAAAMAYSMPLRNLVSFGLCSKEEIQKEIDKLMNV